MSHRFLCFIISSFHLLGCNEARERRENYLSSGCFEMDLVHYSAPVPHAAQVLNDEWYVLSEYKNILKLDEDHEWQPVYSFTDSSLIQQMVEKVFANDTTYDFIPEAKEPFRNYYVDEFFIDQNKLYLSVRVLMPYYGDYEGQLAQVNQFQRLVVEVSRSEAASKRIHSVMVTLQEFKDKSTNQAYMEDGFVIVDDDFGVVRNLAFTENRSAVPELLRINAIDQYKWELAPLVYYPEVPKKMLTTTFGNFHGNARNRYCGALGCIELKNDTIIYLRQNPIPNTAPEEQWIIGLSDDLPGEKDSVRMQCNWHRSDGMIELLLIDKTDSVHCVQHVGNFENLIAVDFLGNEALFLWSDTLKGGFNLLRCAL